MRFTFPVPGGVAVDDDAKAGPEGLVEFGDGVVVIAQWRSTGDTIQLSVPTYRTAKGTQVAAGTWRLVQRIAWRSERMP